MMTALKKKCRDCQKRKQLNSFYAHPNTADLKMAQCKECHKGAMKRLRRERPSVQARERERAKQPHRRAAARKRVLIWKARNPKRYRATVAMNNAIRDGRFKRGCCGKCGTKKNVFGIHSDYSKPLKVKWRCALCYHRGRFSSEIGIAAAVFNDGAQNRAD